MNRRCLTRALAAVGMALCAAPAAAQAPADTIYRGGTILTMEDAAPRAQAVAVAGGRILAVGAEAEVMAHRGGTTEVIDLGEKALLPGFFDAHGHAVLIGVQALSANLLAPPDGDVTDIASLQDKLRDWIAGNAEAVERINLVMGFGYDDSQLAEQRHPTRDDLDAISADVPIYLVHQSGHLGTGNFKALEALGISADSPDPAGGVIRRREGGAEPNGVLEETAHIVAFATLLGQLGSEGPKQLVRAGTGLLARYGYTTGQEARAFPAHVAAMKEVAAEGGLDIDLLVYPDVLVDRDLIAREVAPTYAQGLRIGGAKLTIDGTPQGFTAWRDRPYYAPPSHLRADYVGYPAASADQIFDAVDWAYANDIQILTHANGEAASDLLIAAIETAAAAHGPADRRPAPHPAACLAGFLQTALDPPAPARRR